MILHDLSQNNSIISQYIAELRDINIQKDSLRFRNNITRVAELMAYELSKILSYKKQNITTPLAISEDNLLNEEIVLGTLLRAGLPFHQGFLKIFDKSENCFISAFRKYNEDHSDFEIVTSYMASPSIENKTFILLDPMIATGHSILTALEVVKDRGNAKDIHIACLIGSQKAIDLMEKKLPADTHFWIAVIDPELDEHNYIVPGLGDAGDLCYGEKL